MLRRCFIYLGSGSRASPGWLLAGCCLFGGHDNSRPRAAEAVLSLINAGVESGKVLAAPTPGVLPTSLAIDSETHIYFPGSSLS